MADITTLVSGIVTRIQAVLGSDYSELGYVLDVTKNNFKGSFNGYGVVAGDIAQTETSAAVLGAVTVVQDFTIKLTNKYPTSQAGDLGQRAVGIDLQEKAILLFKDLVSTRAGSPSVVLNVLDGMNTECIYHEDDYICEIQIEFQLMYRKNL